MFEDGNRFGVLSFDVLNDGYCCHGLSLRVPASHNHEAIAHELIMTNESRPDRPARAGRFRSSGERVPGCRIVAGRLTRTSRLGARRVRPGLCLTSPARRGLTNRQGIGGTLMVFSFVVWHAAGPME
jgi:hypothetical protein